MAILTGTKPVNSGNAGWTQKDVMDALENAFADLQMHGGTAKTGVPIGVGTPVNRYVQNAYATQNYNTPWFKCGGQLDDNYDTFRYFDVKANGTTSYKILERLHVTNINSSSSQSWSGTGELYCTFNQSFKTGDAVVWSPASSSSPVADDNITGLTLGNTYYIIRLSDVYIKLAASEADALAGTAIDLSGSSAPVNGWTSGKDGHSFFRRPDIAGNENLTIETFVNDSLNFYLDPSLPGNFTICSGSSYAADKVYNVANKGNYPYDAYNDGYYPAVVGTGNLGAADTHLVWGTEGSHQSEDEVIDLGAAFGAPSGTGEQYRYDGGNSIFGNNKIVEYCYANDTNATMKGVIKLKAAFNHSMNSGNWHPYWKYTVPGTVTGGGGAGKDLKLRIYRHDHTHGSSTAYRGNISHIQICSVTDGWTKDAEFTIPASAIAQSWVDPNDANITDALPSVVGDQSTDIVFGVNSDETTVDAGDAKPNLIVTDFGATSTFFQKSDNGSHAVLKLVNESDKVYGTTYWSFSMPSSSHNNSMYSLILKSGTYYDAFNSVGTSQAENTTYNGGTGTYTQNPGRFVGLVGQDVQYSYQDIAKNRDYNTYGEIARTQSTNSYPLEIRYYKDQAQDTNFAVIQFVQIINSVPYPYMTFTLPRGSTFGNPTPGMDLDYLYHGGLFTYVPSGSSLQIKAEIAGYTYPHSGTNQAAHEPATNRSKAMDSLYGYLREPDSANSYITSTYSCNIGVGNSETYQHVIYYRNAEYDDTNALANYYKPIKGIPINAHLVPCPYYIPDDFVLIQVATTPGLTAFRPGDTITVSGSEKYVIILGCYNQSVEGLNEIAGDSTQGMLFCGRVPN